MATPAARRIRTASGNRVSQLPFRRRRVPIRWRRVPIGWRRLTQHEGRLRLRRRGFVGPQDKQVLLRARPCHVDGRLCRRDRSQLNQRRGHGCRRWRCRRRGHDRGCGYRILWRRRPPAPPRIMEPTPPTGLESTQPKARALPQARARPRAQALPLVAALRPAAPHMTVEPTVPAGLESTQPKAQALPLDAAQCRRRANA